MTRRTINQDGAKTPVNCCVCLNLFGTRVPATTFFDRYLVCDEHADLAQQEFARDIWTYDEDEEAVGS